MFRAGLGGSVVAAAAVAALVLVAPAHARTVTLGYTVETRGDVRSDVGELATVAADVLSDDRGWPLDGGLRFTRVTAGPSFRLILATPAEVEAAAPVCSAEWSCRVGDDVLINEDNWRDGTAAWTGSLAAYRTYLVNHEVGHWLGLGHAGCPGAGALAPVMQQQSIALEGCRENGLPLQWERERVAAIWDVRIGGREQTWPIPIPDWFWEWARWYRGHGEFRDEPFRSPRTRPASAPTRIPQWAWDRLDAMIDEGAGTLGRRWPVPLPQWWWTWARWYLGRAEFDGRQRDPAVRPEAAPRVIPEWGWTRLRVLLGQDVDEN